jgi:hypothetical protein
MDFRHMWPATAFGPRGEGWLRYGLVVPLDRLKEGMARLAPVIRTLLRNGIPRGIRSTWAGR